MRLDGVAVGRYLAFKERARAMINAAAFDDDQRLARTEEWERDMQLFWLSAQKTIDPDRAQEAALASVGNPAKAGSLREPWWYRLAFYHRLQAIRLLLIVTAGVLVSYLHTTAGMVIRIGPEGEVLSVIFYAANSFLGGVCAALAYWSRTAYLQSHQAGRAVVSLAAIALNAKFVLSFISVAHFIATGSFGKEYLIIGPLLLLGCVSLFLAEIALIAELCDLPSRKPSRQEEPKNENKPDVFAKMAMPFVWIARRLL